MRGKRKEEQQTPVQASAQPADKQPGRITPVDIQQKEFRLAFRGYNERDVDQFLDDVTEEVARLYEENKRLREDMGSRGTVRLDAGGASEADAIVRRANEEAARILAEAEARARAVAGSGGSSPASGPGPGVAAGAGAAGGASKSQLNAFLAREREFLQSLAGLIQGHAEAVKEGMRRSREERPPSAPEPGPQTSPPVPPRPSAIPEERAAEPPRSEGGPGSGSPGSVNRGAPAPDPGKAPARQDPPTEVWRPSFDDQPQARAALTGPGASPAEAVAVTGRPGSEPFRGTGSAPVAPPPVTAGWRGPTEPGVVEQDIAKSQGTGTDNGAEAKTTAGAPAAVEEGPGPERAEQQERGTEARNRKAVDLTEVGAEEIQSERGSEGSPFRPFPEEADTTSREQSRGEASAPPAGERPPEAERGDRSLRELFWGED